MALSLNILLDSILQQACLPRDDGNWSYITTSARQPTISYKANLHESHVRSRGRSTLSGKGEFVQERRGTKPVEITVAYQIACQRHGSIH